MPLHQYSALSGYLPTAGSFKTDKATAALIPYKSAFLLVLFITLTTHCISQPIVVSFSPNAGPVGTSVTIAGTNFSSNASDNIVFFGAVKSQVLSATSSTLTVQVPVGATFQPITVTVNGLTAYAANSFLPTYSGGGNINSTSFVNKTDYTTDLFPNGLAIKDFDGDGKADLAVPNNYSISGQPGAINVLRNTSTPGTVSLAAKQSFVAGVQTYAIAVGDLDGDGKPDIASCSIGNSNFSAFVNTSIPGTISFAAGVTYPTATDGHGIAIGDIDGDGKPDIAIVGYTNNVLSVFRNTSSPGNISFSAKIDFATALGPEAVVIGDMDGDGKADIAVTNSLSYSVSLFKNISSTGSIAFGVRNDLSTDVRNTPTGLLLADLNGDSKPDLAAVTKFNSGYCGTRNFKNVSTPGTINFSLDNGALANTGNAYRVAAGDVNGDGIPDLALGEASNNRVSVFQNAGGISGGNLFFYNALPFYAASAFATGLADLDGDGKPELISTFFNGDKISVYQNACGQTGIASFSPASAGTGQTVTISGNYLSGVTAVSFGGVPAASFTVTNATTITAVVGTGASGSITVSGSTGSGSAPGFTYLQAPVVTSFSPANGGVGNTITITGTDFLNISQVRFGGVRTASFTVESPTSIKAVLDTGATGLVEVINNNGTGSKTGFTYTPMAIISVSPLSAGTGSAVTLTGTNFTGATTVLFGETPATSFTLVSPTTITAVVGGGSSGAVTVKSAVTQAVFAWFTFSNFPIPAITSMPSASAVVPGNTITLMGSNFNLAPTSNTVFFGATKGNVITASPNQLTVTVPYGASYGTLTALNNTTGLAAYSPRPLTPTFAGNGYLSSGTFQTRLDYATTGGLFVAQSDLDIDGKPDLLIANGYFSTQPTAIIRNTSTSGTVALSTTTYLSGLKNELFKIADVDGDGKPDLIGNSISLSNINISRNTSVPGSFSFAAPINLTSYGDAQMLDAQDMDGDGKPDIICPNLSTQTISIFRNTSFPGTISFTGRQNFSVAGQTTVAAVAGDLDGDGLPDVVVVNNNPNTITVFRNTSSIGNISLSTGTVYTAGSNARNTELVDVDGDGKQDIVVLNLDGLSFSVFRNTSTPGAVSFAGKVDIAVPRNSYTGISGLSVGDLDGDTKADIVVANATMYAFKNTSTIGNVLFATPFIVGSDAPYGSCVVDMDADKKPEIIAIYPNGSYSKVSVFKNNSGEVLNRNLCPPFGYSTITSNVSAATYQWMLNTGSGFVPISNNANYSGATTATLSLNYIPSSWSGYQYLCKGSDNYSDPSYNNTYYSNSYTLKFVNTWTGAVSNAWENPGNWSCGTLPDSNTDIVINSGTITVNSNVSVRSMKVSPGASITVGTGFNMTIVY